jgi:membrane protein insertase Oxa1/YidC/SpoIIIJ
MPIHTVWWALFGHTLSWGLFVPHLNDLPSAHALLPGLPIPALAYLVIPLLAAVTTFLQSRTMQHPPSPVPTEPELLTQSNCFSIIQQYFVTGWGGLRTPAALVPAPAPAVPSVSQSAKTDEEG